MGFDSEERKAFLCDDGDISSFMAKSTSPSSNHSSSSGFTTPFGSESDDDDFAAELSRQMAECMLREQDEEERKNELNSNSPTLRRTPCIGLKNQFPVGRVGGAELTQQMNTPKTEKNYGRFRDRDWRNGSGRRAHHGSGMQAVFLGGPGSRNGSSGTGVFLPRVTNNSVELKKKSGLSTVLIPTRVLEALEVHFKSHSDSAAPQLTMTGSPRDEWMTSKGQENRRTIWEKEAAIKDDEIQILPQEWTY